MTIDPMNPVFQLLACSGPGAAAVTAENSFTSYALAGVSMVILLVLFRLTRAHALARSLVYFPAIIMPLHPAWLMSGSNGDCGALKALASIVIFSAMLMLLGIICLMVRRRAKR